MPDDEKSNPPALDRQAYLRTVRQEMLKNLGLPEDTRPQRVGRLLEIKARLDQLKKPEKEGSADYSQTIKARR